VSQKLCWSSNELLFSLNKLGYVHFNVKHQVDEMEEGRPFYYDESKKEYGFCPFIPFDYEDCKKNSIDIILKARKE